MNRWLIVATAVWGLAGTLTAQTKSVSNRNNTTGRSNRDIKVTERFEPSFSLEPLMLKLKGRPSEVVPFEFSIKSAQRDARVEILPIGLRQEISGQIMHSETASAADNIRLITSPQLSLTADTPAKIEGVLRLPNSESKYHSYGILVRDIGNATQPPADLRSDGSKQTQASIQFITQYVLRLDVEVEGIRGEQPQQLVMSAVKMVPFEGRPKLQVLVENPTDTTFEFQMRAWVRESRSDRNVRPLQLTMPVRAAIETEDRYIGRILGQSRVYMEELLPSAIAGGGYEVDVELMSGERVIKRTTVPIQIDALDFPAQEVLIAQVGESTQISPSQLEFSLLRGGNRRLTVLLKNRSKENNTITLRAIGENELEIPSISIQPGSVTLPPQGSRKLSITLRNPDGVDSATIYGRLLVSAQVGSNQVHETRELPISIIVGKSAIPQLAASPLQWNGEGKYPGFETVVENSGSIHCPLNARLAITDANGRSFSIPAGFGRWLMPGESSVLQFRVDRPLASGTYTLHCAIAQGESPIELEQSFVVSDFENANQASLP